MFVNIDVFFFLMAWMETIEKDLTFTEFTKGMILNKEQWCYIIHLPNPTLWKKTLLLLFYDCREDVGNMGQSGFA